MRLVRVFGFPNIHTLVDRMLYLVVAFTLTSCSPPSSIGSDFFPEESFVVEANDVTDIHVRTIARDTLFSTNAQRLLVGLHNDPVLGTVSSRAYFQVSLDDVLRLEEERNYRYDSLTLVLPYEGYTFYDTLRPLTLAVHQLREELTPRDEGFDFFTTDTFAFDPTPLATTVFKPRPRRGELVEVRLADELGLDFFEKLLEEEPELLVENDFRDYFPGIMLVAQSATGPVVGFSRQARLELHLTDITALPPQPVVRTYSAGTGNNFNQITTDRTGTPLEGITPDSARYAVDLDNLAYLQAGTALFARIDFPKLRDLTEQNRDEIITRAELLIRVVTDEVNRFDNLPPSIGAFWLNAEDEIINTNEDALLIRDLEFDRDTYYALDLTEFVQFQLLPETDLANGIALGLGDAGDAVDRLVIGNAEHPAKIGLRLFVLRLKDN